MAEGTKEGKRWSQSLELPGLCRRGCLHAAEQHSWGGSYRAVAFACLPSQPRAHPTEPQCHLAMMAPTDRKGTMGWQRQDPVSCSSCQAPTLPHSVVSTPPLLGHLVPQGLEILPSVSACLSTPAQDPQLLRQE